MTGMNTKMQFEAMEKALPYAAELLDSEELKAFKENLKQKEKSSGGDMMKELLGIMLVKKREAVFGLLGAISGKTAEEIAEQDWAETKKLMENPILNDVCDFFIFSVRMVKSV